MPEKSHLSRTIQQLHRELEESDDVDEELQASLKELENDIGRMLQEQHAGQSGETLGQRAGSTALRFRISHPRLEMILNELADTLGRLGI